MCQQVQLVLRDWSVYAGDLSNLPLLSTVKLNMAGNTISLAKMLVRVQ